MKINLKKLRIEIDYDGTCTEIDCARDIANYVKNNTADIGLEDVCREIYYSEAEVDIPTGFIDQFCDIILASNFKAPVKRAIRDVLTEVELKDKETGK